MLLHEVKYIPIRDHLGSKLGARRPAALHRSLHGASNDAKLTTLPDRCLQAVRQSQGNRRRFRRFENADWLTAFQADGEIERGESHKFGLGCSMIGLKRL